jgi:class 3 adenylate cyclase
MTATRRLAAIMAIDVVGYSRLMGEDEAGTALSVRTHREAARPIVAGFGGRIVKTTGDGLLLEFPSVVAAVEGAIAIQKLMVERNADTPEAKRIDPKLTVRFDAWEPAIAGYLRCFDDRVRRTAASLMLQLRDPAI